MRQPDVTANTQTDPTVAPPPEFDPRRYPVIGQHFYGIPRPWRHAGDIVATIVADLARDPEIEALVAATAAADADAQAPQRDARRAEPHEVPA